MNVSLDWLRQYCSIDVPRAELLEKLSTIGLNVEDAVEKNGDLIIELEVTSNRGDCMSHIGVAREIAAAFGGEFNIPAVDCPVSKEKAQDTTSVEILDADLCPRYTARVIRGVKVGSSPDWLQKRIKSMGRSPVNNIVDITNFVMLECGQPLHAFDLAKLDGGRIVVRRAKKGEKITALDATQCDLAENMLVIADAVKPAAIAGVIGGADSEVSASTVDILLESAAFNPVSVRRTARAFKLESDASTRFGRGTAWDGVDWASRRVAALIVEIAGGELLDGVVDVQKIQYEPARVALRFARIPVILGIDVPASDAVRILKALGFEPVAQDDKRVEVLVPSYRSRDVCREIDLIEEVARHYGYDKIDIERPIPVAITQPRKRDIVQDVIEPALVARGFCETLTVPFVDKSPVGIAAMWDCAEPLEVRNPVNVNQSFMRRSMLPSLLAAAAHNENHGAHELKLFEVSNVYLPRGGKQLPEEKNVVAILAEGGFAEIKGVVEALFVDLNVNQDIRFELAEFIGLDADCTAAVLCGEKRIGVVGMISQDAASHFGLRGKYGFAEIDFLSLVGLAGENPQHKPLPRYPAVERDLAVVMDDSVTWRAVEQAVFAAKAPNLRSVEFVDLYKGKQLDKGKKSLAFRLIYRSDDATLTGEEVAAAQKKVIESLEKNVNAILRK